MRQIVNVRLLFLANVIFAVLGFGHSRGEAAALQEDEPSKEADNSTKQSHRYWERLDLTPLPRNNLLGSFSFDVFSDAVNLDVNDNESVLTKLVNYGSFPRSVGQIVKSTRTHELHLRFSHGRWDSEEWGSLPNGGLFSGGMGVEVWAWIEGVDEPSARESWYEMVNALSGLFCASLNFVNSERTTVSPVSFIPESDILARETSNKVGKFNSYLYHGSLPREAVCTENLTPFLKLLPCKGHAGLSSLLDGHRIFDAKWQSMSLSFYPKCSGSSCTLHLAQKVDVVVDVTRSMQRKSSAIPYPLPVEQLNCDSTKSYHSDSTCFPLREMKKMAFSLSDIFGHSIHKKCAVVNHDPNSVCVHSSADWSLSATNGEISSISNNETCYSLSDTKDFDLYLSTENSESVIEREAPPVIIQRSMTGRGQQHGGMRTIITNPSIDKSIHAVYFESLPWYMKPYMHSMTTHLSQLCGAERHTLNNSVVKKIRYKPFLERSRSTYLELELEVPPDSELAISYDFDNVLLYLSEYPPDANRGFDIPPGVLTVFKSDDLRSILYSARTSSLLLSLPTPDFSMPYNVIILTSTVMALAFGMVYNILVRRFVYEVDLEKSGDSKSQTLVKKLKTLLGKKVEQDTTVEQDKNEEIESMDEQ
ncbi:GPI transamidase component PIG-T [Dipodascopsis uninucleata]